jgi:hypothetical protein
MCVCKANYSWFRCSDMLENNNNLAKLLLANILLALSAGSSLYQGTDIPPKPVIVNLQGGCNDYLFTADFLLRIFTFMLKSTVYVLNNLSFTHQLYLYIAQLLFK